MITRLLLAGLIALNVFSAMAIELPDIGDSSGAIISPEREYALGLGLMRQLYGQGAIMNDPETRDYLQSIGSKLVANSDGAGHEYTFFPVNAYDINAFAAPGGFIGVNAGLIINSRNESELAGVLAHEVSHVTQRHIARSVEYADQLSFPVAVAMLGALILGVANPQLGMGALTAVQAGAVQGQIDFTRQNEQEADRVGMALLSRTGFDPSGMPGFFERLQRANRLTDAAQYPEYLRTHPVTQSRIADATSRLNEYPPQQHIDSLAYHLTRARLMVMGAKSPRHAVKSFEAAMRDGSLNHNDATRYGYVLALTRADRFDEARREIRPLLDDHADVISYQLAAANIEAAAQNYSAAIKQFESLQRLYPGYRPIVMHYAETLLRAKQPKQARNVLLDYGILHGTDRYYYELLAEAEGKAGNSLDSHLALAEYYYLSSNMHQAVQQLKIAERQPGVDYYHCQRIRARMAQFDKERREEMEAQGKKPDDLPLDGPGGRVGFGGGCGA